MTLVSERPCNISDVSWIWSPSLLKQLLSRTNPTDAWINPCTKSKDIFAVTEHAYRIDAFHATRLKKWDCQTGQILPNIMFCVENLTLKKLTYIYIYCYQSVCLVDMFFGYAYLLYDTIWINLLGFSLFEFNSYKSTKIFSWIVTVPGIGS